MGATNAPTTCPACGNASPSHGHLKKHQKYGELLQVGQYVGSKYVLVWMTPDQAEAAKKAKVA